MRKQQPPFKVSPSKHPLLYALIQRGEIHVDNDAKEYWGRARGSQVSLGLFGDESRTENYLRNYPGPAWW